MTVQEAVRRPATAISLKVALAVALVALGVVLAPVSFPIGPARVSPPQHIINVVAGIMLGPVYAVVTALAISIIRNVIGTGTFLAFPGSIFGALFVGLAYWYWLKNDNAAWFEPIGTAIVGALVSWLILAGNEAPQMLLGFMRLAPASIANFGGITGPLAMILIFGVSSVPGAIIGYLIIKALRRANLVSPWLGR